MEDTFIILITVLLVYVDYSLPNQSNWNDDDDDDVSLRPLVCKEDEEGCIKGIYMKGFRIKFYEAFLGIPFAEPPIHKLRFANPKPVDTWNTTIIADTEKDMCLQKNYFFPGAPVMGSEDCLYLNIYRPKKANLSRKPLPVIVYLYGGGFFSGSAGSSFVGAQYFMDTKQVILVTVSYRLGVFGFLSTGDKRMPGNFGLKDQALAFKWINKNIKYFNGNPNLVTIFGESSGAASVNLHLLSDLSRGLFHRAALLSGSCFAPITEIELHPLEVVRKQAKYVGISHYKSLTTKRLAKELRKVDAIDLLNSGDSFKRFSVYPLINFKIVIEDAKDANAFLTKDPKDLLENGKVNYVPLLVSSADNEGFIGVAQVLTNDTLLNEVNRNPFNLLPYVLLINDDTPLLKTKKIKNVVKYYLDNRITLDEENKDGLDKAITDYIRFSIYKIIKLYTKHMPSNTPVNIIKFSFKGRYSFSTVLSTSSKGFGVVHRDDLIYYFNQPALFPALEIDSPEAKASETLIKSFVKFAKTGVPEKWVPIDDCKYNRLRPADLCDYQQILREGNDVKIKLDKYFDFKLLSIWE